MRLCTIDGCTRALRARGWCATHWARWKAHGDPNYVRPPMPEVCEVPDCEAPSKEGRYCSAHRARLTRLGTFELPERADRHSHSMGYQIVKRPGHPLARGVKGAWIYEHRIVLFDAIGPGWHACHRCGMQVSWELTYPQHLDALVVDHLDEDKTNNAPENLVPSCAACNFARSNRWVKQRRKEAIQ